MTRRQNCKSTPSEATSVQDEQATVFVVAEGADDGFFVKFAAAHQEAGFDVFIGKALNEVACGAAEGGEDDGFGGRVFCHEALERLEKGGEF